jgi:ElaA protein
MTEFIVKTFEELNTHELYEILCARADVFISEEKILYPDADGIDYRSLHVFSLNQDGKVTGYLRMFPMDGKPGTVQMGRVLTRVHGTGLGRELLNTAIKAAREKMHAEEICLDSQKHAVGFYEKAGFHTVSDEFIEAGIPHIKMCRSLRGE